MALKMGQKLFKGIEKRIGSLKLFEDEVLYTTDYFTAKDGVIMVWLRNVL